MVDNSIPTTQFHPYQPQTATPASERLANQASMGNGGALSRFRGFARSNGGLVLGGLAALVIGAGLVRRRGMR